MAGPAWDGDFPDPFVLPAGGAYWAYGTNAGGRHVQVLHSTDLITWQARPSAVADLPGWVRPGLTWSPAVLARPGGFVLYVTARYAGTGLQAIMVATAGEPGGPFVAAGDGPLVFQRELGGSIDPSPFVDRDGRAHLLWKADANALGRPSSLWIQELSADGLALVGEPTELLGFDRRWEDPLVEAPCLVRSDHGYVLFYSAGRWNSDGYAIGYATADRPTGPFRKATRHRPWLGSTPACRGPGGQELFVDAAGGLRMAYHGWGPDRVGYRAGGRRALHLADVELTARGPRLIP